MKRKTIVLTCLLGVLGVAGAAIGSGLVVRQATNEPVAVNAAVGDKNTGLQLVGDALPVGWTNTANPDYQLVEGESAYTWTGSFTATKSFRIVQAGTWDAGLGWSDIDNTASAYANFGAGNNDNNILCNTGGTYTISVNKTGTAKLSILTYTGASYTVNEFAVVDGIKESSAFATETAYAGVAFTPTSVMRISDSKAMQGWFTDEACTTAFASKTILTANTTLYAKYVAAKTQQTVYFSHSGFANTYIYSFGGNEQFGAWPGTKITAVTNGATFNGVGAVYKMPLFAEYADTHIIFNNNLSGTDAKQTNNLKISDGALYLIDDATDSTGSTDMGAAANVVYEINLVRNAVAGTLHLLEDSICGVSQTEASELIGKYNALTNAQKAYVDASTDYTYDSTDTGKKVNVPFTSLIAQLSTIANSGGSPSIVLVGSGEDASFLLIVTLTAMVASLGAVIAIASRKKKKA